MKVLKSYRMLRLSVTIRWLAGGSCYKIALAQNMFAYTVHEYIEKNLSALNKTLSLNFSYCDASWFKNVLHGFSHSNRSALSMCCEELDGIAVMITEPAALEVTNVSTY